MESFRGKKTLWSELSQKSLLLGILLMFVVHSSSATDYCSITSQHTMCLYTTAGPSSSCSDGQASASTVDSTDKQTILDKHNYYRNYVASGSETQGSNGAQPSAKNMKELVWNDELATVAQRLSDQCVFQHDCNDCRKIDDFTSVGQNIFTSWSSSQTAGADWAAAVKDWYDEVQYWDQDKLSPFTYNSKAGHYTQVAWADTEAIGCGYTLFKDGSWWQRLYVCNYGPAGNWKDATMYEEGTAASNCASGASSTYTSLCS